jgi:hypothetical protein
VIKLKDRIFIEESVDGKEDALQLGTATMPGIDELLLVVMLGKRAFVLNRKTAERFEAATLLYLAQASEAAKE